MVCVEFVRDPATGEPYPDEIGIGKVVSNAADELGLMVRPVENLNIMSPPLIITKEDVDFIVATLREAIPVAYEQAEAQMADKYVEFDD
jgi:adenosylmethionine-8-amino-7-oxononanoate aminotransferase